MKCSVSHLDTGKLHPLCVQYPKQTKPQPAYVEFNTRTGSLTAGRGVLGRWVFYHDTWHEIGNALPMGEWEGKLLRWPISYELTEPEVNSLLDEIAEKIKLDAEEDEWSVPSDYDVEQLAYNAWRRCDTVEG